MNYAGSFEVRAVAKGVRRHIKGKFRGILDESRDIVVIHRPPEDGDQLNIADCNAKGFAKGTDPTTKAKSETQSHIPFP